MRFAIALAATLLAGAATAQDRSTVNASSFNNLSAAGAAQFNEAVKSDPQARQYKVAKSLNDAGHRSGQLLEKTRP